MATTAWTRLLKDKGAAISICFILFIILVALLGYFIAPYSSPNADHRIVEIQAKKPGHKQLFLKSPRQNKPKATAYSGNYFLAKKMISFLCL